jgi:hypothetical protein
MAGDQAPIELRRRPLPDQLDYLSDKLATHVDPAKVPRDALIAIGAAIVHMGVIAAELRKAAAAADQSLQQLRDLLGEQQIQWGVRYTAGVDGYGPIVGEVDPIDWCDNEADAVRLAALTPGGVPVWHLRGTWWNLADKRPPTSADERIVNQAPDNIPAPTKAFGDHDA